jgi:hypothetical protein
MPDCAGQGVGLSVSQQPENAQTANSSGSSENTTTDYPGPGGGLSADRTALKQFWTRLSQRAGLSATWGRTIRDLTLSRVETHLCSTPTRGLSKVRAWTVRDSWNREENRPQKSPSPLILLICGQINTNCHQTWYA